MPLQFSRVRIERNYRTGIKIVAASFVAIPVRSRIAYAPIRQVELRIVGAGHPNGSSTVFPRIRIGWPCLVTGLARSGYGVKAPGFFSCFCVVCGDEPAD